ncbi:MAG: hypothetical protein U5R31_16545 [Acidimicrobiia bacterium]|nr:hypothetical protein [Acidimicrobiia bacterium]
MTAGDFFNSLLDHARAAISERGVKDLLSGYGWTASELAAKTDELCDIFDLKDDEDAYELLRKLLRKGDGN